MSTDAIQAKIKNLPPLPLVAHKLVSLMQQDDCSANDVTKLLCSDQALAGKVLKLANSSFYGLSGEVGSVSRAVVILGFSAIRSMALGLGVAQSIKKAARNLDLSYFWAHALFVGSAARTLAVENGRVDPEEVFISGLIHDLGRLILELTVPGLDQQLADVPADRLLDAETTAAGMPHTKAGQKVMRHWNLPEALVELARFHHHPTNYRNQEQSLNAFVQLGELMARALGQSREPAPDDPDPAALAAHIGISLTATEDLLARTCQEVGRTRAFLEVSGVELDYENPLAHLDLENPDPSLSGTAVYLGTCPERAGWVNGQLGIQAWRTVSMRPFLGGEAGEVDLAIIDPRTINTAQATKLNQMLSPRGVRVVTLGPAAGLAACLPGVPELPVGFQRSELLSLCGRVPA
ncbi:MAG: HDOD domain-containing protein [Candidatus Krumholzibacteriia bacterium]